MIDPTLPQPSPQGLGTEREPVALGQFLRCQRRPKVPIPLRILRLHRRLDPRRDPPVRWYALDVPTPDRPPAQPAQ